MDCIRFSSDGRRRRSGSIGGALETQRLSEWNAEETSEGDGGSVVDGLYLRKDGGGYTVVIYMAL